MILFAKAILYSIFGCLLAYAGINVLQDWAIFLAILINVGVIEGLAYYTGMKDGLK